MPLNAIDLVPRQLKTTVPQLMTLNDITAPYGLSLTQADAALLLATRDTALKSTGRLEFGSGIIDKIIEAFYDSPYLMASEYVETLTDLIDAFYYFKNELHDRMGDDALIAFMRRAYDDPCNGAVTLLTDLILPSLASALDQGMPFTRAAKYALSEVEK
ncbi:hypothetical protein KHM83_01850 [Fusibacter paucivorans]|uniref:Uncharacterized protein n=1 Tax=Fusibacter paucivorans TaxID=76009 RepID=A0ABS5PK85_9FIRM|nr:DUF6323 family protein [Fusibacter paucivorans]MBS7525416.1 hypothetical protein [Fusibacter paucivorans]